MEERAASSWWKSEDIGEGGWGALGAGVEGIFSGGLWFFGYWLWGFEVVRAAGMPWWLAWSRKECSAGGVESQCRIETGLL